MKYENNYGLFDQATVTRHKTLMANYSIACIRTRTTYGNSKHSIAYKHPSNHTTYQSTWF